MTLAIPPEPLSALDPELAEKIKRLLEQKSEVEIETPFRAAGEVPKEFKKLTADIPSSLVDKTSGDFIPHRSERVSQNRTSATILCATGAGALLGIFGGIPGLTVGAVLGLAAGVITSFFHHGSYELELSIGGDRALYVRIIPRT